MATPTPSESPTLSASPSASPTPSPSAYPLFAAPVSYEFSGTPYQMATGDVNNDGNLDFIVGTSQEATLFIAKGDGTFDNIISFRPTVSFTGVQLADLNNDGRLDIIGASPNYAPSYGLVFVMMQESNGNFNNPDYYQVSNRPYLLKTYDYNNDGNQDVLVLSQRLGIASMFLGYGNGSLSLASNFTTASWPSSVAVADLNQDNIPDVIVGGSQGDGISVSLGYGNGTFPSSTNYLSGAYICGIDFGDFNQDNRTDLSLSECAVNKILIMSGYNNGTFSLQNSYHTGFTPVGNVVADFNGDGAADIATVSSSASHNITVFSGNNDGTFNLDMSYNISSSLYMENLISGDFNNDGKIDLMAAASFSITAVIALLNIYPMAVSNSPSPSITPSISKSSSQTASSSITKSPSPSITPTKSATQTTTSSVTITASLSSSITKSPSVTLTSTTTITHTATASPTVTASPSATVTTSPSPSITPSVTTTSSITPSPSPSASPRPIIIPEDNFKQNSIIYSQNGGLAEAYQISQVTSGKYVAQKLLTNSAADNLPTSLLLEDIGDFNGDGVSDHIISTIFANDNAGQINLILGRTYQTFILFPLPITNNDKGSSLDGQNTDKLGFSIDAIYNYNQNSVSAIIIGSPSDSLNYGQVSIIAGNTLGLLNQGYGGYTVYSSEIGSLLGFSVSTLTDTFYSNQFKGVLFGAPGFNGNSGVVYILNNSLNLPASFFTKDIVHSYGQVIYGSNFGDLFGTSISSGDFNHDGHVDILVGAPGYNSKGACFLFWGNTSGTFSLPDLNNLTSSQGIIFRGENNGDLSGFSVVNLGDINGDGIDDFAIGSPGFNGNKGKITVIFGSSTFSTSSLSSLPNSKGFTIYGVDIDGALGSHLINIGDVNQDGYNDLFISADKFGNGFYIYCKKMMSDIYLNNLPESEGLMLTNVYNGIDFDFQLQMLGL